jgi:hypothetical protein
VEHRADREVPGDAARAGGIRAGAVPEDEFTLEEFGISVGPAPAPISVMYYLLAFAAICGAGALGLRCVQARYLKSAPAA